MRNQALEKAAYKVISQECANHPEQYALVPKSINTAHLRALITLFQYRLITISRDWRFDNNYLVRVL